MSIKRVMAVVGVFLLLSGCGGKKGTSGKAGGGPDEMTLQELFAQLGQSLIDEGSSRFEFSSVSTFTEYPTGAQAPQPKGSGLFDYKGKKGSMKFDFDGEGSGGFNFPELEQMFAGDSVYMKIPDEARGRFGGKQWIKTHKDIVTGSVDLNGLSVLFDGIDVGKVTNQGEEEVRGDKTTRYGFQMPMEAFVAAVPKDMQEQARSELASSPAADIPGKIWIDDEGRPRRYAIDFGTAKFKMAISYEFFDFGVDVEVEEPPAAACHEVKTRQEYQDATAKLFTIEGG